MARQNIHTAASSTEPSCSSRGADETFLAAGGGGERRPRANRRTSGGETRTSSGLSGPGRGSGARATSMGRSILQVRGAEVIPRSGEASAGERTRTSKGRSPPGPKPGAYASSATPARIHRIESRVRGLYGNSRGTRAGKSRERRHEVRGEPRGRTRGATRSCPEDRGAPRASRRRRLVVAAASAGGTDAVQRGGRTAARAARGVCDLVIGRWPDSVDASFGQIAVCPRAALPLRAARASGLRASTTGSEPGRASSAPRPRSAAPARLRAATA
jgi:hypothetical protein